MTNPDLQETINTLEEGATNKSFLTVADIRRAITLLKAMQYRVETYEYREAELNRKISKLWERLAPPQTEDRE